MHQHHTITPTHRLRLASHMIAHQGDYGMVSHLGREYAISRQSLYTLKARGQKCLERVFCPKEQQREEEVWINRAVLTLLVESHASREGIQKCLEDLLGIHVSTGKISAIIHEAGKRAQAYLKCHMPEGERIIAIDEQYGEERGEGYLNIVDALSCLVLASIPPVTVDSESWQLLLWQMEEQGLQWKMIVSDGGKAIHDAVQKVTPESIHQRDVWHVLHECQKVQMRINNALEVLHERTPTVKEQAKRVAAGKKPLGRNPKTDVGAHEAELHQVEYVANSLQYLSSELQRLLGIVVLKDQGVLGSQERLEELDALLALFSELCKVTPESMKKEVEKLFRHVQLALAGLVGFCQDLDAVQEQACDQLGKQACHLIGWAWQRRAILGPQTKQLAADFPPAWQPRVTELFRAWDEAVRSSSAVENWHSILRPHLAVHRHLPASLLAIFAVWHNHRVAPRGVHQGQSPLMRAGLAKEPADWLEALGYPSANHVQSSILSSEGSRENKSSQATHSSADPDGIITRHYPGSEEMTGGTQGTTIGSSSAHNPIEIKSKKPGVPEPNRESIAA